MPCPPGWRALRIERVRQGLALPGNTPPAGGVRDSPALPEKATGESLGGLRPPTYTMGKPGFPILHCPDNLADALRYGHIRHLPCHPERGERS